MDALHQKYQALRQSLASLDKLAVAFSGGVDSSFLLMAAHEVLGARVLAITAESCLFPARDLEEAAAFCRAHGIRQLKTQPDPLRLEGFCQNPKDRCYLCKRNIFSGFLDLARENGISAVAEGSNMDDVGDYRPGMRAVAELGILSPLRQAGLYKEEIRRLSREMGLDTWDKPSFACLASRFVYGESITQEKLRRIESAEQLLLDLGFRQMRVRLHGELARIEVLPGDLERFLQQDLRAQILTAFRELGFSYVTLDLQGYRTGSMNEIL